MGRADQKGNLAISGLAPGQYYIAAWGEDAGVRGVLEYPPFLAGFRQEAAGLALAEGSKIAVTLKPVSAERFALELQEVTVSHHERTAMKNRVFAATVLALAQPTGRVAAQAPVPAPAADPYAAARPTGIKIQGSVISSAGEPVKKASVTLTMTGTPANQRPISHSETTGDDGKFEMDDLAPGTYMLSAAKTGFVAGRYGARSAVSPGVPLALSTGSGAVLKDLQITLTPEGIVSGHVSNQDGDPAARKSVTVYRAGYTNGRKQMQVGPRGPTDEEGDFSIGNVPPGRYYLVIQPGNPTPGLERGLAEMTTFFPNARDISGAAPLDVAAGAHVEGINVRQRRERVYTVKGKVLLNGALLKETTLVCTPLGVGPTTGLAPFVAVRDGTFQIASLAPGAYSLERPAESRALWG